MLLALLTLPAVDAARAPRPANARPPAADLVVVLASGPRPALAAEPARRPNLVPAPTVVIRAIMFGDSPVLSTAHEMARSPLR